MPLSVNLSVTFNKIKIIIAKVEKMNLLGKKIKVSEHALVQKLGDGLVIMNLDTEDFYELNEAGKHFWELLTEHLEIAKALSTLQQEYDVSPELLEKDMIQLISGLVDRKIIAVV